MRSVEVTDVVRSLAGHDGGRLFVVTGAEGQYAYLADGKRRRLQNPKKKKLKHLEKQCDFPFAVKADEALKDSGIRRALATVRNAENRGGE